jgi:aminoglycoside/choline kinase family phosphotransferase
MIKSASSDASFRSYWRVFSKDKTYIVMDAPPEHENCLPFIDISNELHQCGVNVPVVLAQDLSQGFLLLSDLGTVQYLQVLNNDTVDSLYNDAIEALHKIQQNASWENIPVYDARLLLQELKLFDEWFIGKHLAVEITPEQKKLLTDTYQTLISNALQQPQTFVHRDYHSRNLMKTKDNNPGILDFQDAVIGAATYDLVSLLKDCYIQWDTSLLEQWVTAFGQKFNALNQTNHSQQQWQKWFDWMGLQRHLKVLGIFCRLNYRDNKPDYLKDLCLTLHYIKQVCAKYPEFSDLLTFINDATPSMERLCEQ